MNQISINKKPKIYNPSMGKSLELIFERISSLKSILFFTIILLFLLYRESINIYNLKFNKNILEVRNVYKINTIYNHFLKKIRIGIFCHCLHNGGRARITSLLVNSFYKLKIFDIFLFTRSFSQNNEYKIPIGIKRKVVKNNLISNIFKKKLDVFIYELDEIKDIEILNKYRKAKVIYYIHSSIFYWIYSNYTHFKFLYKSYKSSKYIVSIIPFENDYLFKKWGIQSILMNNFMTFKYNSVIQSKLSKKTILMIGRANNILKRFEIGIQAMEYINNVIPDSEINIISNLTGIDNIKNLCMNLNLNDKIKFLGYTLTPELYFKNASLHIFPSITEGFPLVLSETKIYGIPNILLGIDYVSISKEGTVIIYDDSSESLSFEIIKILKNNNYRKKLGNDAKNSMRIFDDKLLITKWIELIASVLSGDNYYQELKNKDKKISKEKVLNILKNQVNLMKFRNKNFINITNYNFENFTFLENLI